MASPKRIGTIVGGLFVVGALAGWGLLAGRGDDPPPEATAPPERPAFELPSGPTVGVVDTAAVFSAAPTARERARYDAAVSYLVESRGLKLVFSLDHGEEPRHLPLPVSRSVDLTDDIRALMRKR
jgi:hypothetical protein